MSMSSSITSFVCTSQSLRERTNPPITSAPGSVSIGSGSCLLSSEKGGGETRRHEKFQWNGTIVKVLTVRKIYRQYLDLKEYLVSHKPGERIKKQEEEEPTGTREPHTRARTRLKEGEGEREREREK